MSDEREMTLREWCAKLPACHLVNRELRELEVENQRLRFELDNHQTVRNEKLTTLKNRAEVLEAKLAAVAELPRYKVWSNGSYFGTYRLLKSEDGDVVRADELEARLK